eukprot:ctg_348.g261
MYFAGAYCGYGFHEDAVRAGLEAARRLLPVETPWPLATTTAAAPAERRTARLAQPPARFTVYGTLGKLVRQRVLTFFRDTFRIGTSPESPAVATRLRYRAAAGARFRAPPGLFLARRLGCRYRLRRSVHSRRLRCRLDGHRRRPRTQHRGGGIDAPIQTADRQPRCRLRAVATPRVVVAHRYLAERRDAFGVPPKHPRRQSAQHHCALRPQQRVVRHVSRPHLDVLVRAVVAPGDDAGGGTRGQDRLGFGQIAAAARLSGAGNWLRLGYAGGAHRPTLRRLSGAGHHAVGGAVEFRAQAGRIGGRGRPRRVSPAGLSHVAAGTPNAGAASCGERWRRHSRCRGARRAHHRLWSIRSHREHRDAGGGGPRVSGRILRRVRPRARPTRSDGAAGDHHARGTL